jgi:hypothetical protein
VIHQPSSDIFKLFDRLLLMDQEGHPVYYGDPVDAVVYFKRVTGQVNSEVGQCSACGNVNPEQIFNILEAKLVDEYGNETDQRRISPEAWNEVFRAQMEGRVRTSGRGTECSQEHLRRTRQDQAAQGLLQARPAEQIGQPPVRAHQPLGSAGTGLRDGLLPEVLPHGSWYRGEYIFRQNDNIPQYLFIAVIVACS